MLFANGVFLVFWLTVLVNYNFANDTQNNSYYDYIVVGSGAGGGPLAARLAIAGFRVAVIDAGTDQGDSILYQVPSFQLGSTEYPPMEWRYFVNHYADLSRQATDSKMTYRTTSGEDYVGPSPPPGSIPLGILYPRSGTLGGCTSHNAMITILPHDNDWSYIQSITGDPSWSPTNMRKYFKKLENNHYQVLSAVDDNGHGYSGWLSTDTTPLSLPFSDMKILTLVTGAANAMSSYFSSIISTITELASALTLDLNAYGGVDQEHLYQIPLATKDGARNGPREFLLATANAINPDGTKKYHLDIILNTLVTKVNFDQSCSTPKAIGVSFLSGPSLYKADPRYSTAVTGRPGTFNATKEVILSAGAFNTPQLLKLSGIGPRDELESLDIPLIVDLPGVGKNLQDRYEISVISSTSTDFSLNSNCAFGRLYPDPCLTQWTLGRTNELRGPYVSNGLSISAVLNSSVSTGDPDLFISGAPAFFRGYFPGFSSSAVADARHWTWVILKAHSRNNAGSVMLRSADPTDTPVINFHSFDTGITINASDALDLQALYEGVLYARRAFAKTLPLAGAAAFAEEFPGPAFATEADIKHFIQREAWGHHASCTCPIGRDGDPAAVLDSRFRVVGVTGLRVVDASVFPKIPGFFIALPIYMIAEKAADVMLEDA